MTSGFSYSIFPKESSVSEYRPFEIDRYDTIKKRIVISRFSIPDINNKIDNKYLLILTNPTEHITLQNITLQNISHKNDKIFVSDKEGYFDNIFINPVVKNFYLSENIRYPILEMINEFDLISSDSCSQYYGSYTSEFLDICKIYISRRYPSSKNKYISLSDKKSYNQTIKIDLLFIKDTKNIRYLFLRVYNIIDILKKGGDLVIYICSGYSQILKEILYMLTLFFNRSFIYRGVTQPYRSYFYILEGFRGVNDNQKDVMRSVLSSWQDTDLSSIIEFKNGDVPLSFTRWFQRNNEDIYDIYMEKIKQIQKLYSFMKKESKDNVKDKINEILQTNKEFSIEWCHTNGVSLNTPRIAISQYSCVSRVFPKESGVVMSNLKMSSEGLYSASRPRDADSISKIIIRHISRSPKTLVVTDGTSNIGGNVISFSKYFRFVNAVEISRSHCSVLKNNLNVYRRDNVKVYCADYLSLADKLKQDVIFLDPPWGGTSYKKRCSVKLCLSGVVISDVINRVSKNTELVVIKIPPNFDFVSFFRDINKRSFTIYKIRNYMIIVIRT